MFKRLLTLFVTVSLCLSLFSCSEEVFSYCELRLPLPNDFEEIENENFDVTYSNGNYAVAVCRISFIDAIVEGISETMSAYEFGELWLERCKRRAKLVSDEFVYCEYKERVGGSSYYYLEAFYRSPYAYFVVLFMTVEELKTEGRNDFLKYAENLYFTV